MSIFVVGSTKNKFLDITRPREHFYVDQSHSGVNADKWNAWWCEITGLFYMWAHPSDDNIYGIEHYRRYFSTKNGQIIDDELINNYLSQHDIILYKNPQSCAYHDMCITNKQHEIDLTIKLVNELFGKSFGEYFDYRIRQNATCEGNMFITSKPVLTWYCSALFKLLTKFDVIHQFRVPRITGYIAEYFMGPWMEYHKLNICWCDRIVYNYDLTNPIVLHCT